MKNLYRIETAVEFIEKNLDRQITLSEIAENTTYSMYHLTRLFNQIFGETIMEYVRKRRLTVASRELINTNKSIIEISLDCKYDSQEAFTRAFTKMFKMTPAKFRKRGIPIVTLERQRLNLTVINYKRRFEMKEPRIEKRGEFTVVGMLYQGKNENGEIPAMWQEYMKVWGKITDTVNSCVCYGICYDFETDVGNDLIGTFKYIAGLEVSSIKNIPDGMLHKKIPAGRWLVFEHIGKLDTLNKTYKHIYAQHVPESEHEPDGMELEVYDDRFIPDSDDSIFEIWVKIKE